MEQLRHLADQRSETVFKQLPLSGTQRFRVRDAALTCP